MEPWSLRPKPIRIKSVKKEPTEGVIFLCQLAYIVILCSWILTCPEVSIQAQTPPCSPKRWSRIILLPRTTLSRESRDFYWEDIAVTAVSEISSWVKERSLIITSFSLLPSQGNSDLPKGVNFQSQIRKRMDSEEGKNRDILYLTSLEEAVCFDVSYFSS